MHIDNLAITLRPETAQDSAFLEALYRSTRDDLFQLDLPEAMLTNMLQMQFNAQQRGYRTQLPDGDYAIIEKNGEPIGTLITHHSNTKIHIAYIALLLQERKQGHGRRLIKALQVSATTAKKMLTLSVNSHNEVAKRLYRSLDFKISHDGGSHLEMIWSPAENR